MSDNSDSQREVPYDPIWNVRGEGDDPEVFKRLARRAVVALGQRSTDPAEAVDFWLNRVHAHHAHRNSRRTRDSWCIRNVMAAAADYCAEMATSFHEAGNVDAEEKFADFERQFRARPSLGGGVVVNHPWDSLHAILRGDFVDKPTEAAPEVPESGSDINSRKTERKKLRDDYKAACKRAGVKVTDEMIAKAANRRWESRANLQKWLSCDPKYDGTPDRMIRDVFRRKPHLPQPNPITRKL